MSVPSPSPSPAPVPSTAEELQEAICSIKANQALEAPPLPRRPMLSDDLPMKAKLGALQRYISSFEYNFTGIEFFKKKRDRGFKHICVTAKEIMHRCLPIQCVEATYLGAFLTCGFAHVDRIPLAFRSTVDGKEYRHIVLAIRYSGQSSPLSLSSSSPISLSSSSSFSSSSSSSSVWGALGISRKSCLMYKELVYPSFPSLVENFRESYASCGHVLDRVYVGLPLPHDPHSDSRIMWRVLRLCPEEISWETTSTTLDSFAAKISTISEFFVYSNGKLPAPYSDFRPYSSQAQEREFGWRGDGDETGNGNGGGNGTGHGHGGHSGSGSSSHHASSHDGNQKRPGRGGGGAGGGGGKKDKERGKGKKSGQASTSSSSASSSSGEEVAHSNHGQEGAAGYDTHPDGSHHHPDHVLSEDDDEHDDTAATLSSSASSASMVKLSRSLVRRLMHAV